MLKFFVVAVLVSGLAEVQPITWYPRDTNGLPQTFDTDARLAKMMMRHNYKKYMNYGYRSSMLVQKRLSDDIDLRELIKFYLFTRSNVDTFDELYVDDIQTLESSYFDKSLPTKFIIHGYLDDVNSEVIQELKNNFLQNDNYNVIAVDWGLIAFTPFYTLAAEKTQMVGQYLGTFIDFLSANKVDIGSLHIIGHSLGAHVAGFAGANVTSGKIPRISGLDPAKPWFSGNPPDQRLDRSDATFVDCIHTCGGYLGLIEPICHADFYPNGGVDTQPGCSVLTLGVCSHGRSYEYFAESISPSHKFFTAKCDAVPDKSPQNCQDYNDNDLMGYFASPQTHGIFYLETRDAYPFSMNVTS